MSEFKRVVIVDADGDPISVQTTERGAVYIGITEAGEECGVALSIDQCATLIAAISNAAKAVAEGKP
tara:strand:- start:2704 stop:2904 length:201 start_codon:yes stop_codon:yes gene_type:complete